MNTLFIDTHGDNVLVVLYKEGKIAKFESVPAAQNHCTHTVPTIHKVLSESEIAIKDIKEIFICVGPGSFTGVRIGVTIAKTLAYSLNIPIKPISTLTMYAVSNNVGSGKLIVVEDKKGYYFAIFNNVNQEMSEYSYLYFEDFDKYVQDKNLERIVLKDNLLINLDNVYSYLKDQPSINPHNVNPIYVKGVEVD